METASTADLQTARDVLETNARNPSEMSGAIIQKVTVQAILFGGLEMTDWRLNVVLSLPQSDVTDKLPG